VAKDRRFFVVKLLFTQQLMQVILREGVKIYPYNKNKVNTAKVYKNKK